VCRAFILGAQEDPPLVHRQPAIPKLEQDNVRQGFLEQEQYERLLEELPANLKALFVCGYHTGARKNELRRLRWEEVDLDGGLIRLEAGQTKTKRPRALPIYGDAAMAGAPARDFPGRFYMGISRRAQLRGR
jgi:integrase